MGVFNPKDFGGEIRGGGKGIDALRGRGKDKWVCVDRVAEEIGQGIGVRRFVLDDVIRVPGEYPIAVGIAMTGVGEGFGRAGSGCSDRCRGLKNRLAVIVETDVVVAELEEVRNGEGSLEWDETSTEGFCREDIFRAGAGRCATTIVDEEIPQKRSAGMVLCHVDASV